MHRQPIGIIGGSGLTTLAALESQKEKSINTPFGPIQVFSGHVENNPVVFVPRHGADHKVAPHNVNYRANLWALKECSVKQIFAFNVVGGISQSMRPGTFALADQVIDYTWGRDHTYYDGSVYPGLSELGYADMHRPILMHPELYHTAFLKAQFPYVIGGVYGCTQGPRLETAAEIQRLAIDGCDVVGMTAMPEIALARELSMDYSMISYVVNWAAGVEDYELSLDEIMSKISLGAQKANKILSFILNIMNN